MVPTVTSRNLLTNRHSDPPTSHDEIQCCRHDFTSAGVVDRGGSASPRRLSAGVTVDVIGAEDGGARKSAAITPSGHIDWRHWGKCLVRKRPIKARGEGRQHHDQEPTVQGEIVVGRCGDRVRARRLGVGQRQERRKQPVHPLTVAANGGAAIESARAGS
jgi:hypothetical protein